MFCMSWLSYLDGFRDGRKGRSRQYPTQIIMDADYTHDITLQANPPTQAKSLLHSLEQAAGGIHVNEIKTEFMCFNQKGDISTLNGSSLKLVHKFTYLRSSASSPENDICNEQRHGLLLIDYWSYGSQTYPIK